jgi:hypothetical protein
MAANAIRTSNFLVQLIRRTASRAARVLLSKAFA